jgi:hypothetical protein
MLIVGDLDVETTWARMDAAARRARGEKAPRPDDPRFALPEPVMRKISAAATLMRVFAASDDDVLWTPRPVDPSRMARVEWLPTPRLMSGPMPETADVWWGEPTEIAARANHRAFLASWRSEAFTVAPSIRVRSLDELAACAESMSEWVAKAPFSAAGRLRIRGRGPLGMPARTQAGRLLELFGELLVEPWLERTEDLGIACEIERESLLAHVPHRLSVDAAGRFLGIQVDPTRPEDDVEDALQDFADDHMWAAGFRGPYGLDLFYARGADGALKLHLSEVNARRTFGHVAWALRDRRFETQRDLERMSVTLRFGRGAPPDGTIPLLLPGADDDTCAWLETQERRRD